MRDIITRDHDQLHLRVGSSIQVGANKLTVITSEHLSGNRRIRPYGYNTAMLSKNLASARRRRVPIENRCLSLLGLPIPTCSSVMY